MRGRRIEVACEIVALGLVVLALVGPVAGAAVVRVVTSSTDLAWITKEIGRERVEVTSFFKGYQEPELWVEEVFPSWIVRASRADLLIRIGLYADVWMDTVIESAMNRKVVPGAAGHVDASDGIAVLEVPTGRIGRSLGEIHLQGNPHYLLDPVNAKLVVANVLRGLSRVAPSEAERFQHNARELSQRLDGAVARWAAAGQSLRGRKLAAYHKTWSYLARRFGFVVVGYCEPRPGIEPSPADIRQLADAMVREDARLIIHEPVYSPRIPQAVAREVERRTGRGVTVLRLPAHTGGVPGTDDYFAFIDHLLAKLTDALR
jgi:zinc/manganese transport system substrate-binding protein